MWVYLIANFMIIMCFGKKHYEATPIYKPQDSTRRKKAAACTQEITIFVPRFWTWLNVCAGMKGF